MALFAEPMDVDDAERILLEGGDRFAAIAFIITGKDRALWNAALDQIVRLTSAFLFLDKDLSSLDAVTMALTERALASDDALSMFEAMMAKGAMPQSDRLRKEFLCKKNMHALPPKERHRMVQERQRAENEKWKADFFAGKLAEKPQRVEPRKRDKRRQYIPPRSRSPT